MAKAEIGIIGGSGLYGMAGLTDVREERMETPFGDPSEAFVLGQAGGPRCRVPGAARQRTSHSAERAELSREYLRDEEARRDEHPERERGGLA